MDWTFSPFLYLEQCIQMYKWKMNVYFTTSQSICHSFTIVLTKTLLYSQAGAEYLHHETAIHHVTLETV